MVGSRVRTWRLLWASLRSLSHRALALHGVSAAPCLERVFSPLLNVLFTLAFMPLSRLSIIFCIVEQRIMIMFV